MRHLIFSFLLTMISIISYSQNVDLNKWYNQLDHEIEQSQHYVDEKEYRIASLYTDIQKANTNKDCYDIYFNLYNELKSYKNDSSVVVLQHCKQLATQMGRKDLEGHCISLMAFQCSTTGLYQEALTLLDNVDAKCMSREQLVDYYKAYNHVYREMGYYTTMKDFASTYYATSALYQDSLLTSLDKSSNDYLMYQSIELYNQQRYAEALKLNTTWMNNVSDSSREYAIVAYYRYLIYNIIGNEELSKYFLTRSAITDIQHAVMDQGSLWALANLLNKDGDFDRAYRYISFSWDCAMTFGTRVRNVQISPILSVIEKNYQQKIKDSNRKMLIYMCVVSAMSLLLLYLLVYVNIQRKKLFVARNELKAINLRLEQLNDELKNTNINLDKSNHSLSSVNSMLNESNRVKEEYIGRFLSMCSQYVDKIDKYRMMVNRKLRNKEINDLMNISRSTEIKEKELDELYGNFDSVFLHLFPNFVEDFNSLLKPEVQIHSKDPYRLTTDIRIFALIRLGIDDSSKIAEFLHYSVNTIYNYRARIKNGALINREIFEREVKRLGLHG